MIRRDYGSAVAADAARLSVMPLEREGGQAQFIVHDYPPTPQGSRPRTPARAGSRTTSARDLTLADIAAHAGTSTRTLIRRFREQTGTTPLQWLHRARIRQAQHLLETTHHSVERIGAQVGFGSPTAFRDRFKTHHRRQPAHLPPRLQLTPARGCPFALSHAPARVACRPLRPLPPVVPWPPQRSATRSTSLGETAGGQAGQPWTGGTAIALHHG